MTQVAADALGLPLQRVRFSLGDSTFPRAPSHSGSRTMASVGSAVFVALRVAASSPIQGRCLAASRWQTQLSTSRSYLAQRHTVDIGC
jgi:CO/xanthine dehydrogenase Mo-binding subunit